MDHQNLDQSDPTCEKHPTRCDPSIALRAQADPSIQRWMIKRSRPICPDSLAIMIRVLSCTNHPSRIANLDDPTNHSNRVDLDQSNHRFSFFGTCIRKIHVDAYRARSCVHLFIFAP